MGDRALIRIKNNTINQLYSYLAERETARTPILRFP